MKTITTLTSEALKNDARVAEARRLLHEALEEHQKGLTGVRPPVDELKTQYADALQALSEARGGGLYYPYIGSGIGNGPLVELADGSVKYDMICGIGVHYFGHSHHDLLDAGIDAALQDLPLQGHLQQNSDQAALCHLLRDAAPRMDHCFLTTSGVMANENALKICFQKKAPANRVLTFDGCFAGRTLAVSQITDKPGFRDGLPMDLGVDYVPFYDANDPKGSTEKAVSILKKHLTRYPKQHAAFLMELVQGEGGFYPGDHHFFMALIKLLKEHNVAIIADEVQTFGRTPELFAYQYYGLENEIDIITIGKLSQVCATLYKSDFKPRPGLLSQTFTSSTSAIRGSTAIVQRLLSGGFYGKDGKVARTHDYITERLRGLGDKVKGPFGIGAMIAFQPYDGSLERAKELAFKLFDAGVISFMCGSNPTRIRFLLPIEVLTEQHIDEVLKIVEKTM